MDETNQTEISKKELLENAIKIRERGDSFRSVLAYLNRHCKDEEMVGQIIKTINKLEKEQFIKPDIHKPKPSFGISQIMGVACIIGGVYLVFVLWGTGLLAILPFFLIIFGIYGIAGGIDNWFDGGDE